MSASAVRRRSRPSFFVWIRTFWIVALLVAIAAAGAFATFANAPQLAVRGVDVVLPAGAPVTREAVLAAAAIGTGTNVVLLDAGAVRRRVEAIPYVQTASVTRLLLPQPSVRIAAGVRVPYACVRAGADVVTIDAGARVLQTGCVAGRLAVDAGDVTLPAPGARLDDPDVGRLLSDATTIAAKIPLRAIRRDRFGGIEAVDEGGVTIRFGADGDLASKLALVEPVRRAAGGRRLRAIDLRAPSTPIIQFP